MPIDLTTVPDDERPRTRHSRRTRRHRRHRAQMGKAIAGGVLAFAVLGLSIFLLNNKPTLPPPVVSNGPNIGTRMGHSTVDGDPLPAQPQNKAMTVISAPAVSSGELNADQARARITAVRRVIGADGGNDLEVSYEFLPLARAPREYVFAVRSPKHTARALFLDTSARSDVVRLGNTLKRIGSIGPIDVWIETVAPANERVSNVMTIP
jgi:hypothetical protein